jgi:hypothetical protein
MPISLSQIRDELLPGLYAVTGKYNQLPRVWNRVYKTRKSNMALERMASMRYMALAAIKQEGGTTTFDNQAGQRYIYNQEHDEIGLGFAITRKAIDDNLYKDEFGPSAMGLRDAFLRFEEVRAADVINTATTYDASVGGDGKALAATDHPVDGGTFANLASPAVSLNETALLNAQVAINANFRDNANQRMNAKPRKLLIPPQLEPTAIRLLKTELRPGTANNDVNAILSTQGGIPDGYQVWNYLTSEFGWQILTDQDGLIHMNRIPYESDMSVEFTTDNLLVKGYQRDSFGYNDPRCGYFSRPTS